MAKKPAKRSTAKKSAAKSPVKKKAAGKPAARKKIPPPGRTSPPVPKKVKSAKAAGKGGKRSAGGKGVLVMVATRKGAWFLRSDTGRKKWSLEGPHFLGCIINHLVLDPRDGKTLIAAVRTGHLGPTVYRSADFGKNWTEAEKPPAFTKAPEGQTGRVVDHVFWLTPGHASEKDVWYAGTSPQGIFRSEDAGKTWQPLPGFNDERDRAAWTGGEQDQTPDGGKLHSLLVDPRDANHMYIGLSGGGCMESRDKGKTWTHLNLGVAQPYIPTPDPEFGHDPHCIRLCPTNPDRLYRQSHFGIYRIDRPGNRWTRIGDNMPKDVGDVGFPMTVHPRNDETCWVFPMDGSTVWPRVSPGGKPAVYRTTNGGKTWKRQDKGLPREQAWYTVKRQAMGADDLDPLGLYFGTTSGEVWMSRDEGDSWVCIAEHLPHIYAVEAARA